MDKYYVANTMDKRYYVFDGIIFPSYGHAVKHIHLKYPAENKTPHLRKIQTNQVPEWFSPASVCIPVALPSRVGTGLMRVRFRIGRLEEFMMLDK